MPWEPQRKHYHKRRQWLNSIKNVPCGDCGGIFPPECMDFDHRDPSKKKFTIGSSIKIGLKHILDEIDKCDIVCANCHRLRTNKDAVR
jgi:hypothetical protein